MAQQRIVNLIFVFAIVHWATTFATIIFLKERPTNPSTTASSSSTTTAAHCEEENCTTTTASPHTTTSTSTTPRHSPFQFPFPGRPQGAKIEFVPLATLLFGGGLGGGR